MKSEDLVLGKFYAHKGHPNAQLEYRGLVPEGELYAGEHIFYNILPSVVIPGVITDESELASLIIEFKEEIEGEN